MESDNKLNLEAKSLGELESNSSLSYDFGKDEKLKIQHGFMSESDTQSASKINSLLKNYQEFKRKALGNKKSNNLGDSAHGECDLPSFSKKSLNKFTDETVLTTSNISSKLNFPNQNQANNQKKQSNQAQFTHLKNFNQETACESNIDINLVNSLEAIVKSQSFTSPTSTLLNSLTSHSKLNLADDKFIKLLINYESILYKQSCIQSEIKKLNLDLEKNKKLVIQYLDACESAKLQRNARNIQLNELENEKIKIQKEIYYNVFKNRSFTASSDLGNESSSVLSNLELTDDCSQKSEASSNNKFIKSSSSWSTKTSKQQTNESSEPNVPKCSKEKAITEDKKQGEENLPSSFEKCRSKVIDLVRKRKSSFSQGSKNSKKTKAAFKSKSDESKASVDLSISKIDKMNKMVQEVYANFLNKQSEVPSSISTGQSKRLNKSTTKSTHNQDTRESSAQKFQETVMLLDSPENSNCSVNDSFITISLNASSECAQVSPSLTQSSTTATTATTTNTTNTNTNNSLSSVPASSTEPSLPKKPTSFELLESVANKTRETGYVKTSNESLKLELSLEFSKFNDRDVYTSSSKFVKFELYSNYIYVNFRNGTLTRYNRHNVQDLTKYLGLTSSVRCFFPLISLNRLYSGSDDKLLQCHDLKTGLLLKSFDFSSAIVSMDVKLGFLTIGLSSGMVHQLDLISEVAVKAFQGSDSSIHEIKITGSDIKDAKLLIITFRQMLIRQLSNGSLFYSIPFEGFIPHSFYPTNHIIFYANKCGIKIFNYVVIFNTSCRYLYIVF